MNQGEENTGQTSQRFALETGDSPQRKDPDRLEHGWDVQQPDWRGNRKATGRETFQRFPAPSSASPQMRLSFAEHAANADPFKKKDPAMAVGDRSFLP
jgi:hypothetical protein